MSDQHTVIEVECLEDGCEALEEVTHLGHARTDRQTEIVLDAHLEAARLHEEEAGHEFNVSVDTGTPSEMEALYEDLTGERLVADGGTEQESAGGQQSDPVLSTLDELDRLDKSHDPTVAIFDGHEARPVIAKVGDDLRMLSSWVLYAREVSIEDIRETWDEHGVPRTVSLSTQSDRFDASDFREVADLE
jgi:hypothetical protein